MGDVNWDGGPTFLRGSRHSSLYRRRLAGALAAFCFWLSSLLLPSVEAFA